MITRSISRRIVSGLAGSLGLLALAAPSVAQVHLIRPMEADFTGVGAPWLITDAGQPGMPGSGGIYVCDPNDPNDICVPLYAPTSGPGALKDPSAAEALGNGEVAIADTGNHRVLIVNQAGQITWNSANVTFSDGKLIRGPSDIQILPDGTPSMADNPILIACKANNRVVVLKRTGQVLWAMNQGLNQPLKAERLPNGNTMIVESTRVIEVNAAKQIVASFTVLAPPPTFTDAERLADGSTLVLDGGNGRLLQYMQGQAEPFIRPIEIDLMGASDVDVIEQENGGLELLITTPVGALCDIFDF